MEHSKSEKVFVVFPPESVSKLLFKKYVDPNTHELLEALEKIIGQHKDPKAAKSYKDLIAKTARFCLDEGPCMARPNELQPSNNSTTANTSSLINTLVGTQIAFLYKQKYIEKHQITTLRFLFRRICSSISNAFRILHLQPFNEDTAHRIGAIFIKFKDRACELVHPYLSDDTTELLAEFLEYMSSESFLTYCFSNPEEFKPVVYTFTFYLDFQA